MLLEWTAEAWVCFVSMGYAAVLAPCDLATQDFAMECEQSML